MSDTVCQKVCYVISLNIIINSDLGEKFVLGLKPRLSSIVVYIPIDRIGLNPGPNFSLIIN